MRKPRLDGWSRKTAFTPARAFAAAWLQVVGLAGQSGDTQGFPDRAESDCESVEELATRAAAAIAGIEDTPNPDVAEVRTKEVPEDDVPTEYDQQD
jgi:hypothetical protein